MDSDQKYSANDLRFAFVVGFSLARPVPEPPHRHSDEDCELMRDAFRWEFGIELESEYPYA